MINKKIIYLIVSAATVFMFLPAGNGINNTVQAAEKLVNPGNLIVNGDFHNNISAPWNLKTTGRDVDADYTVENGECKVKINNLADYTKIGRYAVQLSYSNINIQAGHTYNISFKVTADKDCMIYPLIGDSDVPYNEYWNGEGTGEDGACKDIPVKLKAGETKIIKGNFSSDKDVNNCNFSLQMAGDCAPESHEPYSYKISEVSIKDSQYPGTKMQYDDTSYAVKTNQIGYYTCGEKYAEAVLKDDEPVEWGLLDADNNNILSGITTVCGKDEASGDNIHKINFSRFKLSGKDYKIVLYRSKVVPEHNDIVNEEINVLSESRKFNIGYNLYEDLKYKASKFFYYNRSGLDIESQYTDGNDNLTKVAKNHKDNLLRCSNTSWYKEKYTLDVSQGWYDSHNFDKNVSKSGIAVWTLQNQYEHALNENYNMNKNLCADGDMNIPESIDGIPDILNEARYNLEFMLKMQVPDGYKFSGMVHEKVDTFQGYAGVKPGIPEDSWRQLEQPTTAATLNMAAAAAQAARLWQDYDKTFADKCLNASKKAYEAAKIHSEIYADVDSSSYDESLTDEFYWAACELYSTTGDAAYLDDMKSNENYLSMPVVLNHLGQKNSISGCFDWQNVEGLGTLSLLSSKNNLQSEELLKAKDNVTKAADVFIENQQSDGYGNTIKVSKLASGVSGYQKDSNGYLANTMILLGYANDFNKSVNPYTKYLNAANGAMNYLLGANANSISYISGFGDKSVKEVSNEKMPVTPDGVLAAGPQSEEKEDTLKSYGLVSSSTAAAKMYKDSSRSAVSNETSTALNASLEWAASYLDTNNIEYDPGFPGDVNGDGCVNVLDYTLLRKYLNNHGDGCVRLVEKNCDVNQDGHIDFFDLVALKAII